MGQDIVNYNEEWAKKAEMYAAQEQQANGTMLTMRGGILKFGDQELPGNQACVIILDAVKENTYYTGKFDPNDMRPPLCYAFGRDAEEMAPHVSMGNHPDYFVPQAADCQVCPHNVFGSAETGRGKACKNGRRLALLPAGYYSAKRGSRDFDLELFSDPKHFQTADMAFIKLAVGSTKEWASYVNQVAASLRRPPHGVITRLYVEPDEKYQYLARFEVVEQVPDEIAAAVMARHDDARRAPYKGYEPPVEREPVGGGSLKGLRRR